MILNFKAIEMHTCERVKALLFCLVVAGLLFATGDVAAAQGVVTPTLTNTPSPTPWGADAYEPNDSSLDATVIGAGQSADASLHTGDVDWWAVYLKAGRTYRIEAVAQQGDPRMVLYTSLIGFVAQSDDCAPGDYSPCIVYSPALDEFYYVEISSQVHGLFARYQLRVTELLPTATPTATANPTAQAAATPQGADAYEPNETQDAAVLVGVGNPINASLHTGDVDWWKVYLKAGRTYHIEAAMAEGDAKMGLYSAQPALLLSNDDCAPGNLSPCLTFTPAGDGAYYVEVASQVAGLFARYNLSILEQLPTATPWPSSTPTPEGGDAHEPNDEPGAATLVGAGTSTEATLHANDVDWWKFYLKAGRTYRVEVVARQGDPWASLHDSLYNIVAESDDCAPGNPGPCFTLVPYADEVHYLQVSSKVAGLPAAYTLRVLEMLPTATATRRPTDTPEPTATPNDAFEPNHNFDTAAGIAVGGGIKANLVGDDNDFYKLYAEAGVRYRCDVSPSSGGLDTNLIVYDQSHTGIGGNNNREPGNAGSSFEWYAGYTGWYYLLVGAVTGEGSYSLMCVAVIPTATPTRTPRPTIDPASLPTPTATPTPIIIPTATSLPGGGTPGSGATPVASPTPTFTPLPPVSVVVYYDENNNGVPDVAEGVRGAIVMLINTATNKSVDWGATDETGFVALTVPPDAFLLRVSVPFLGFSKQATAGQSVIVQIKAQRLPGLIP